MNIFKAKSFWAKIHFRFTGHDKKTLGEKALGPSFIQRDPDTKLATLIAQILSQQVYSRHDASHTHNLVLFSLELKSFKRTMEVPRSFPPFMTPAGATVVESSGELPGNNLEIFH